LINVLADNESIMTNDSMTPILTCLHRG